MNDIAFSPDTAGLVRSGPIDLTTAGGPQSMPILIKYLRIATRRRWYILASVAVCLLIGVLLTLLATPQYTATTRLEISREGTRVVNLQDVQPETSAIDNEFYQTQYSLLGASSLAERVARELKLADDPKFFALFGLERVLEQSGGASSPMSHDARVRLAGQILLRYIRISPIRLSRLVDVSFTSPDPGFSAKIANAWAQGFIAASLERRFDATSYARNFLEQRLAQLRQRLEESERQLVGYAANQQLINIPVVTGAGENTTTAERSLTADSLAALNTALDDASADRIKAQSRLNQAAGTSTEALNNPTLTELRQKRAEAAAEYSHMMSQFEPDYPPAKALAAQIQQLDQSITREEARVKSSLSTAYTDALERERLLTGKLNALKQNFLDQKRRSIQYNIFQREVDTNRELYNGLLQRYKEIGVAGGVGNNNIAVVDPAEVPTGPAYPRPLLNLLAALAVGLVLGVGLAFLREQIDETVTDPAELERMLGLPLLGTIPVTRGVDPREELRDPKSGLTEAYLSVQSTLSFASANGIPASLAITSTRPGEGKSTSAHAIAYSLARTGSRIVLVDGDMRSPSIHSTIGLANDNGLSNYLSGNEALDTLLRRPESEPYAVLTAGPQPPNAAELLRGPKLEMLIAELLRNFDHVIVDSPPVMGLADAPLIASRTEGTVFVMESGGVKTRSARTAIDRLRNARSKLLGTILTKFDMAHAPLSYGYGYGYGYGSDHKYGASAA